MFDTFTCDNKEEKYLLAFETSELEACLEMIMLRVCVGGGDDNFPQNNFGLLLGSKQGFLTLKDTIWTCLPLYDRKDGMKSMLRWTTGQKDRSARRE